LYLHVLTKQEIKRIITKVKGKGKVCPITGHGGPEGE
jgi:hypothetical protein